MKARLGLIGGRGYTGRELLNLVAAHPGLQTVAVASRSEAGRRVCDQFPEFPDPDLRFCAAEAEIALSCEAEAFVLALPNGQAAAWVEAISARYPQAVIVDLSADHRGDERWVYGLPEINRAAIRGQRLIANPGCYATAAMLALWPFRELLGGVPSVFGVSGYSGAGSTPSPRNNPQRLADNLLPYQLTGHAHQVELGRMLGRDVALMPHVASFFRGLLVTAAFDVTSGDVDANAALAAAYADEPLITLSAEPAEPGSMAGKQGALVGPAALDPRTGRRLVVTAALDNLLKGAAVQALQNLNLALGFDELTGVTA
ncbi:MAG: N-acetyl-gamma-glutamyl-phosphate reductase [Wenzhouxiangellaceae bacterium]